MQKEKDLSIRLKALDKEIEKSIPSLSQEEKEVYDTSISSFNKENTLFKTGNENMDKLLSEKKLLKEEIYKLELSQKYLKQDNVVDYNNVTNEEIHILHQTRNNQIYTARNKTNSAIASFVIASILIVIGLVLLVLSFRYNVIKERIFTPGSVEFVCCILCLSVSIALIVYGIVQFVLASKLRQKEKETINQINYSISKKENK